ncbi:eukaryotic translation initiation factor 4B1 [Striga hermonthica]|uniref:Eukaryotic translation initiation factor 4B1 n=1 Tax=Striga hermonthica TaxID=68872 RepID=A0A9N7N1M8_STRHE|nr:eukaryotic translation initiation factor 4B1 [Striga hermonthica]
MSKSPWGKIGNWAAEAERAEAEEREAAEKAAASNPPASFPSLKESVTTAKQKKKTKMSLQEFTMKSSSTHSGSVSSRGLTPEEFLRLPTGPKERSPDEMQHGRLGGGFSNYGSRPGSGGPNTGRPREYDGRRSYGFDDDNRRAPPPESRVSDLNQPSRADEVDNWASMKKQTLPDYDSRQDRPGGRYSSLARPREEVLAEKGLDWKKLDLEVEVKNQSSVSGGSRPMSSHSSRPGSQQSSRSDVPTALGGEVVVKERPKVNPFGNAKPREVLLEEKGLDWKKIDLELDNRRVERPETEEEKNLKEQIKHLKNELLENPVEDQSAKHDLISQKERDLELLVRQLDDKVRYSQKIFERKTSRPGSQDGQSRAGSIDRPASVHGKYEEPNRPPSQPGSYENSRERHFSRQGAYEEPRLGFRHGGFEDPRGLEYNERPRSRGSGNDRRSFGGRGFAGSREIDRSGSRW